MFLFQRVHCWFALFAIAGFGLQGLVSNTGALSVLFVNLPFPIEYINGRTFHVNISLYWTFAGMVSGIFYLLCPINNKQAQYFTGAIFLFFSLGTLLIQAILALHFTVIREYLEGPVMLRALLLVPLAMLNGYLLRAYPALVKEKGHVIPSAIIAGLSILTAFYASTVYYYTNPGLAEYHRFLTFHIGIEFGAEMIGLGLTVLLLIKLAAIERPEGACIVLAATGMAIFALLAAGAAYLLWPENWLLLAAAGSSFSMLHVVPAMAFFVMVLQRIQNWLTETRDYRSRLSLMLVGSSLVYHIIGAGMLGLFLAFPATHQYIQGTYIVSAHSHLALFGVFGFLALAISSYCLLERVQLTKKEERYCSGGVLLLHIGLLTMAAGLVMAGGLQTYLLRVLHQHMSVADALLRPYLFLRIGGGMMYMLGSLLLAGTILKIVWQQRTAVFGYRLKSRNRGALYKPYSRLVHKQKELQPVIQRIVILQKIQSIITKMAKK